MTISAADPRLSIHHRAGEAGLPRAACLAKLARPSAKQTCLSSIFLDIHPFPNEIEKPFVARPYRKRCGLGTLSPSVDAID